MDQSRSSKRRIVTSPRNLQPAQRVVPTSATEVNRWCDDVNSWGEMLRLYEAITGDRLRPPTSLDVEQRIKPTLRRAFERGDLVVLDLGLSPAVEKTDEGVHGKKPPIDPPVKPQEPRKTARVISQKTFIDVQLVNAKGKPIAGCKFKLQLPNGLTEAGTLGGDARIAMGNLDPGIALLTFETEHVDVIGAEPVPKPVPSPPASQPKPKPTPAPVPTPVPGKISFELGVFDKLHPSEAIGRFTVSMTVPGQPLTVIEHTDAGGMIRLEEPNVAAGSVDVVGISDDTAQPSISYDEFGVNGLATNQSHVLEIPDKRRVVDWIASQRGIVRRAAWGAKPPKISPMDPDWNYQVVVIHHSGNDGSRDPKEIQADHFKRFDDIGYHYLVHPDGTVYEGRYLTHKGSHTELQNTNKIGILVMGDFQHQWWDPSDDDPTVTQIASAQNLILTLKRAFPTLVKLGGHRDYKTSTECPGDVLYALLSAMRTSTGLAAP